ncbi:MAG: exo-alpha-sialidase [Bacteroidia bacterium]|nr:exo-alpha-sialidase [Bacteroidia bacterium]
MLKLCITTFLIVCGFFSNLLNAQLKAVLIEGDFAPEKVKIDFETTNTKYKDPPHVYFDSLRKIWHATWTQFDKYKSKSKLDHSIIYYSSSVEGKTWNAPKQLNSFFGDCMDGDSTLKGPMPCLGPGGELYVVWASEKGLAFQKSLDTGKTWLKEEKIITALKGGWSYKVDGIKTNGLPNISCDLTEGQFKGRIYVCWSDERNGAKDKDVFIIYSDDRGETWSDPIIVSYRPNHKEQFNPLLRIDQKNGYLYILYFDKQNYFEGKETDLYIALSKNGGQKFENYKINAQSFPFNTNYTALINDSCIKAQWVQPENKGRFVLHEAVLSDSLLYNAYLSTILDEMEVERSFKFADTIRIKYKIKQNTPLTVVITKPLEPTFEKVIFKNKRVFEGNNELVIDPKSLGLKKGNYTVNFYYSLKNSFVWIVDE